MKLATVRRLIYGLLAIMCAILIVVWYWDVYRLSLVAVGIMVLMVIVSRLFWNCPHCGANLGRIEWQDKCPSCGKDLEM